MSRALSGWAAFASGACALVALAGGAIAGPHDALITKHASNYGVPESLVRRVIHIESKGNPRIISKGNYGLMQIRLGTAHSMGYGGTAEGLLDADTNMTYAVKYLAGAYRAAGCNEDRAIAYYQRGFYKKSASNCGPRLQPAVQIAAKKEPPRVQMADAAPQVAVDMLKPKVVQVQTIVRPKTFNGTVQSVPAQSAPTQAAPTEHAAAPTAPVPTAPMQSASLQLAAAPAAIKSPDVQLPLSPPLPHPARRAEAPPQTVAKAPDADEAWPPALTPEPPAEQMLPMPRPRPAKAPKAIAKLESVVSDQSAAERAEPAAAADAEANIDSLLPMPRPRPVKAPKARAVAKLGDASIEQPAGEHIEAAATASSSDMQVAKLDAQAVPLPQPRPELGKTPERDVTPAHRAPHRHVRGTPRKQEPPALIAWFEKLTTPKQAWRRRR